MSKSICIIGAGVIGLTCAQHLAQKGYQVTILARDFPGDDTTNWCSPWAGAVFFPVSSDPGLANREMIEDSFKYFWKLAEIDPSSGTQKLQIKCYHDDVTDDSSLWYRKLLPNYRVMEPHELISNTTLGLECMSLAINPAVYLPWLLTRLRNLGVSMKRTVVESIESARNITGASTVVHATGLGAAVLEPTDSRNIMPVRGQTFFVPDPNFKHVVIKYGSEYTYVIPRAFSGGVILGGTRQEGNSSNAAHKDIRDDILRRVNAMTDGSFERVHDGTAGSKDIVGFRPGRKGGPRLERVGNVVHAYGFDGEGYLYSIGVAKAVTRLVQQAGALSRL